ncbi:MAG: OmpA family protein [Bacteroidales bacterium]|nr:OmpA family protein [Bacteroidales bacterium]
MKEKDGELQKIKPEGEATRILYFLPAEDLSVLQVQRNYQIALKSAGFEIVYECLGGKDEIPNKIYMNFDRISGDYNKNVFAGKEHSYFLAKLSQENGNMYVSAHTLLSEWADEDKQAVTALQILEEKPMNSGKVKVEISADAMAEDIGKNGSVSIYGIHFNTNEATIKEKSESILSEIAELLEMESDLNLLVVGHTDATGSIKHNMDLSKQRAEAVVEFLTAENGVSADRLESYGVGPLSPVASNEDEDGRAQNRRVELVKIVNE